MSNTTLAAIKKREGRLTIGALLGVLVCVVVVVGQGGPRRG